MAAPIAEPSTLDRIISMVRGEGPDLSLRQIACLAKLHQSDRQKRTIRAMAALLGVSKPAITRACDRLEALGLAKRKADHTDKRSVLVEPTVKGVEWLKRHMG